MQYFLLAIALCIAFCSTNGEDVEGEIDVRSLVKRMSELEAKQQENAEEKIELSNKVERLKTEVEELKKTPRTRKHFQDVWPAGTTYIRWGRTTCGTPDSQTVYQGHAAGAHHNLHGGGSNHLCLHSNPQWLKAGKFRSHIYGVEFELFSEDNVFSTHNNGGHSLCDFPSPCVACYVPTRNAVLMIPARITCPGGWTKEYHGYIVAEGSFNSRHRNQYTCWDEAPERAVGATAQNPAVIYPVQASCGSLPCSKYKTGWALTCVVCTK